MIKNIFEVQVTGIVNETSALVDIATVRFDDTDKTGQYKYVDVAEMAEDLKRAVLRHLADQAAMIRVGSTVVHPAQWACINVCVEDLSPSVFEVHGG